MADENAKALGENLHGKLGIIVKIGCNGNFVGIIKFIKIRGKFQLMFIGIILQ